MIFSFSRLRLTVQSNVTRIEQFGSRYLTNVYGRDSTRCAFMIFRNLICFPLKSMAVSYVQGNARVNVYGCLRCAMGNKL